MLLITGVTGHLGSAVIEHLSKKNTKENIAVFSRDANKAKQYTEQGLDLRVGDFDIPSTLPAAFKGVSKLLLISSRSMQRASQQKQVVDAAVAAGVKHIIYTGLAIKDIRTSHMKWLMESHFQTEAHIRKSGVAYTFVRNTIYADALPEIVGQNWGQSGLYLPGGQGKVPYALRREMGEAIANLLLQEGHENKVYQLTADDGYSYQDIADTLAELTTQSVPYKDADVSLYEDMLKVIGLPDFLVSLTLGTVLDVRNGQYDIKSSTLHKLLGRKPAGLKAMIGEVFAINRG